MIEKALGIMIDEKPTNSHDDKEINKEIFKKTIVNVVSFKKGVGFEVYSYIYDNKSNVSENLIDSIECKRQGTKKFEKIKGKLLTKYQTEKFIVL